MQALSDTAVNCSTQPSTKANMSLILSKDSGPGRLIQAFSQPQKSLLYSAYRQGLARLKSALEQDKRRKSRGSSKSLKKRETEPGGNRRSRKNKDAAAAQDKETSKQASCGPERV